MQFELSGRKIDLQAGSVDGAPLRPIEVRLLRYLAERRDHAVPQGELLQKVWGYSPRTRTRTLYSTVHRLRQTLERNPAAPRHLITVTGVGVLLTEVSGLSSPEIPVGRKPLLEALHAAGPGLVALVGPGGVGKTEIARAYVAETGGTFCDLSGRRTREEVIACVERAVGPLRDALEGAGVWILDGADEIEDLEPLLLSWISAARGLQIVVTSRGVLRSARPIRVAPLGAAGWELFARLLKESDPLFDPDAPHDDLVALVERLDGWPLALVLAAPVVASLGPAEALAGLDAWELPGDPDRSARSLRSRIGWSIEGLGEHTRAILRELSVFSRSFAMSVAQSVAEIPQGASLRGAVAALVEAGLAKPIEGTGRPRFALLRLVRIWLGRPSPASERRLVSTYAEILRERFLSDDLPLPKPEDHDEIDEWVHVARLALAAAEPLAGDLVWWALTLLADAERRAEYSALLADAWASPPSPRALAFVGLHRTFWAFGRARPIEAEAVYAATADAARELGLHAISASLHARYAAVFSNADECEGAERAVGLAKAALAAIPHPSPRFCAEIDTQCMLVDKSAADPTEHAEQTLIRAGASRDPTLVNAARRGLSGRLLNDGRYEDALRLAEVSLDGALHDRERGMALMQIGQGLLALRRFREVFAVAEQMKVLSQRKLPLLRLYANTLLYEALAETGAFAASLAVVEEAEREAVEGDHGRLVYAARGWRAVVGRRAGSAGAISQLWSAFETALATPEIGQAMLIADELVDVWVIDPSVVDPFRVLERLMQNPPQILHARLVRAEVLRRLGEHERAARELEAPPELHSAPLRNALAIARASAACEIGLPCAQVPSGAAWNPRWATLQRHRIARATRAPPEGADALEDLVIEPWEHLLRAAVRELSA